MTSRGGETASPSRAASGKLPVRTGTVWMLDLEAPAASTERSSAGVSAPAATHLPAIHPLVEATFRRVGPEEVPVLSAAAIEASALAEASEAPPDAAVIEASEAIASAAAAAIEAEILRRFKTGRRCYCAWVGDHLAAYGWVSFNEEFVGELNLRLRFTPCEAYIWDCATVPAYRQKHLYSALLVYILHELSAEGVCRAWIGADVSNVPSQRGIDRAGFRRIADLLVTGEPGKGAEREFRGIQAQGYPGVPESLVAEAARVFLGEKGPNPRPRAA